MVTRRPLPQGFSAPGVPAGADGSSVPDILRPGYTGSNNSGNSNSNNPASGPGPGPYTNFEATEESVWGQSAPTLPQTAPSQSYRQESGQSQAPPPPQEQPPPPPPTSTNVPTIVLQNATGSSTASAFSDTNPFKRKVLAAENPSPANAASAPYPPSAPAGFPPLPPTETFAQMGIDDQNVNPWQSAIADDNRGAFQPLPSVAETATAGAEEPNSNAWASPVPSAQASRRATPANARYRQSDLISFPPEDGENADWDEVISPAHQEPATSAPPRPPFMPLDNRGGLGDGNAMYEDRHAWGDLGGGSTAGAASASSQPNTNLGNNNMVTAVTAGEGWNFVDNEPPAPGQLSRQSTWENFSDDDEEDERIKKKGSTNNSITNNNNAENSNNDMQPPSIAVTGLGDRDKAKGKAVDSTGSASTTAQEPLISLDSPPATAPTIPPPQQNPCASSPPVRTLDRQEQLTTVLDDEGPRPALPPRSMLDVGEDLPPPQPPRPVQQNKTETYQIKNVTWHDVNASQNPRMSPILLQNANGPCPLVALVNALSLTTPANTSTALVETLSTREQISLNFLLDAVFDELMSPRRSSSDGNLPDVSELYQFLKGLHTGMNVNPRFIPTQQVVTASRRTSLTHLHPTEREDMIPGTFENTREMQLYAAFHIPLVHGWLPAKGDGAFEALSRRAQSYEDVQNLLFHEEELEDKLSSSTGDGLTEEEQALYQDILEIKTFLNVSATQLTPFGLDVLAQSMRPGTFAILFRNDHFSTLYRHPQTMQLLSLVTDAGYATHDEVIWETLVDVNGEHAEFYSGDFRLVGGSGKDEQYTVAAASGRRGDSGEGASSSNQGEWTTVRGRRHRGDSALGSHSEAVPSENVLSRHEQEDRDLALALQLQEEEEERQRTEAAQRNSRLSEQVIEQNGRPHSRNYANRPSNAAGGGRYSSSSQQSLTSPRRSSAGVYANNPLLDDSYRRTSSSSASGSATGNQRAGQYHGRNVSTSSVPQTVRPLVPPATASTPARASNNRPVVHQPHNAAEGEDAPPSYEHAAKQAPYHPPPGAPGSETAPARSNAAMSSSSTPATASASSAPSPQPLVVQSAPSGRPYVTPSSYPVQQPYQQPMTGSRTDRDCIIM